MEMNAQIRRSPYRGRPSRNFWKQAVTGVAPSEFRELYTKKFEIASDDGIATAGSCFAQHIARHLRSNGYKVLDTEPAPPWMLESSAKSFGFGTYSARFGNIYYVRQFLQLVQEALGLHTPADAVWEKDGRFYDAMRPAIEPGGLDSAELVRRHREQHLERVRGLISTSNVLVFTMGLTEGWIHTASGTVYPTAPGTIAGDFDPERFHFHNFTYGEVYADFIELRRLLQEESPRLKFILTVSPVSLAATAEEHHVLPATVYSKSVLRAVAGALAADLPDVDYFPSYEVITGAPAGNSFLDETLRNVTPAGVATVMRYFFAEHPAQVTSGPPASGVPAAPSQEAIMCEEALLEAFGE
ncbi:GSCFA domain-containing protein [Arthrobacter wenxiniae]|uniref:GSCFA domain-containing protein n=1 Tax=Arthrobacter wenxiniae TaxID=2713570 RepID=A0A7Y7IG26_9MICC|nr:GSCFA domain-containing protein [Arthrobacter wenxiniae]NVM94849.1 GSCFA domain-containing protein [Arthrobacter wenxiniae]